MRPFMSCIVQTFYHDINPFRIWSFWSQLFQTSSWHSFLPSVLWTSKNWYCIFLHVLSTACILTAWLIPPPSSINKWNITTFGNASLIPNLTYMPFSVLVAHSFLWCGCESLCLYYLFDFSIGLLEIWDSSHLIILPPCAESNICKKQYALTL